MSNKERLGIVNLKKLKSLREKVNWEIEEERVKLLENLYRVIAQWKGQLPNLRDIFRREELEWLMIESVNLTNDGLEQDPLIDFVVKTGYRDEPDVDEDGKPLFRRTTPLHHATEWGCEVVDDLFKIYNRFDVNYTDELGITHLHVACAFGCVDVVEKFLELGQDPNCLTKESGATFALPPLHLALKYERREIFELLLKHGADPNSVNKEGSTPLHVMCKRCNEDGLVKLFFKINDDRCQTVQVNARDNLGWTPLQLAVLNLFPDVIDMLLNHGADLSGFVFPSESHFGKKYDPPHYAIELKYIIATDALNAVERLEKRGYELDRNDALMIMKFLAKHGLFEQSVNLDKCWYNKEEFAIEAKKIMIKDNDPDLSFYDLIRLQPEQAAKLIYKDSFKAEFARNIWNLPNGFRDVSVLHLCEKRSRGFCRRWALDSFLELTRYQLPILCCEKIIDWLMNEDLFRISLAATG